VRGSVAKARLLVVDDETDMLDFVERVFRHEYEVRRASTGEDALRLLADMAVDVVIADQKMARMTGLELLEQLGERVPGLVRVLVSGYAELPAIERARARGTIDEHVVKPVDAARLRSAVRVACERASARGGPTPLLR
jgi:DNA-binding NtrC family response regulator